MSKRSGKWDVDAIRDPQGKTHRLTFLPYEGMEPYPTRWVLSGGYEEFFKSLREAQSRLKYLIKKGSIENAEIHKEVPQPNGGWAMVLEDEWADADARGRS